MSYTPKNILITAGSGHIGQELLPLLQSQPATRVVLPTTNATRTRESLQSKVEINSDKFAVEEGSIQNPLWFQDLLAKYEVDTVFLCLTGEDELFTTMNLLDCLARSKTVKHLVYLSACFNFADTQEAQRALAETSAGHVLVKILGEQKLLYGKLPFTWTVIRPTLFFINDLRAMKSMIQKGVYDEPLGEKGVSRVHPKDIALAVNNVMFDSAKWAGKHVPIGSQRYYKGSEIAAIWSNALGKPIDTYPATEEGFQLFEKEYAERKNGAWARDMRCMVESFTRNPYGMNEEQYQQQLELLGKVPEDYETWVNKIGASKRQ